jgi:RNA polymerase sigma factor (sigma-70 family)
MSNPDAAAPKAPSQALTYELIAKAQAGDLEARNRLVELHLRLVKKRAMAAAMRCGKQDSIQDIVNTAIAGATDNDGLIHAIEKFDLTRGLRFSTYAVRWIDNAIQNAITQTAVVRVGRNSHGEARLRAVVAELTHEDGVPPTPREVRARCVFLGAEAPSDLAIERALVAVREEPMPHELENGSANVQYHGADIRTLTDEPDPSLALEDRENGRLLLSGLDLLTGPERTALTLSYGLFGSDPMKLTDIAVLLGVSRQRVGQLKAAALGKLQAHFGAAHGEPQRNARIFPFPQALEAA